MGVQPSKTVCELYVGYRSKSKLHSMPWLSLQPSLLPSQRCSGLRVNQAPQVCSFPVLPTVPFPGRLLSWEPSMYFLSLAYLPMICSVPMLPPSWVYLSTPWSEDPQGGLLPSPLSQMIAFSLQHPNLVIFPGQPIYLPVPSSPDVPGFQNFVSQKHSYQVPLTYHLVVVQASLPHVLGSVCSPRGL